MNHAARPAPQYSSLSSDKLPPLAGVSVFYFTWNKVVDKTGRRVLKDLSSAKRGGGEIASGVGNVLRMHPADSEKAVAAVSRVSNIDYLSYSRSWSSRILYLAPLSSYHHLMIIGAHPMVSPHHLT